MSRLNERRAQRFRAAEDTESSNLSFSPPATQDDETAESHRTDSAVTEWFDLDDAPRNGSPVMLRGAEGETAEGCWAEKRAWDAIERRWRVTKAWYVRNAGGARVAFEPIAWTRSVL